ncbi:transposase [Atopobium sp. oral taxon 416]|nr:transposase [Atopobium sp. oral taxon 416]
MRRCTRTSNYLERLNAEVKRQEKVIGVFPSKGSLIRLVGTYLIEENDRWAAKSKQYWLPAVEEL